MKIYKTPIKSIREKCLDCCNGNWNEVRQCPAINCSLYPYRLGKRPDKVTLDTLKEFYHEE